MTERTFGERLAQARRILSVREWRDVTLAEIGELVDMTGATISRYESGKLPVPKAMRIALESVLPFPDGTAPATHRTTRAKRAGGSQPPGGEQSA